MNRYYLARKIKIFLIRIKNRILRFLKRIKPQKPKQEIANRSEDDFVNFFYPQMVYMLTVKTGKSRSMMSPVKWVTPICKENPMIAISLLEGSVPAKHILKQKAFTLAMIPASHIGDTIRIMDENLKPKVTRFASEAAFFINSYKPHGFPWVECRVVKFLKLPDKTILVAAKVIHITKKNLNLSDRIMHYKDQIFINSKRLTVKRYDRNGIQA